MPKLIYTGPLAWVNASFATTPWHATIAPMVDSEMLARGRVGYSRVRALCGAAPPLHAVGVEVWEDNLAHRRGVAHWTRERETLPYLTAPVCQDCLSWDWVRARYERWREDQEADMTELMPLAKHLAALPSGTWDPEPEPTQAPPYVRPKPQVIDADYVVLGDDAKPTRRPDEPSWRVIQTDEAPPRRR
jgi:hypothetical protein